MPPLFYANLQADTDRVGSLNMKLVRQATAVFDVSINAFAGVAGIIVVGLMISVSASAVGRTVWNISWLGLIESCQVGVLYFTFLGTTWVLRRGGHVRVPLVLDRLQPRIRKLFNVIT